MGEGGGWVGGSAAESWKENYCNREQVKILINIIFYKKKKKK